jgi:hypothetical protein
MSKTIRACGIKPPRIIARQGAALLIPLLQLRELTLHKSL